MSKLEYNSKQELELDGVRLLSLVKEGDEPIYVYSRKGLVDRIALFKSEIAKHLSQKFSVHFAMKANGHPEILKLMKEQGLGIDIVSGGELKRALEAGYKGQEVIFSGVAKTKNEIRFCLQAGIGQFNIESVPELQRIGEIARETGQSPSVVLRLNPDVDPQTHPYIATGFIENKFGIETGMISQALDILKSFPELKFRGLSFHIGSQLSEFSAFREALRKMVKIYGDLRSQGWALSFFDVGGGLGIDYEGEESSDFLWLKAYAQTLKEELSGLEAQIQFEPGRFLVARSGALLTEVQYVKKTSHRNFILCNTGMHHLIRPALYEAHHRILPLKREKGEGIRADVVGPVCESSDFLGKDREFTNVQSGDWLCVADTGAYGAAMTSDYNLFSRPREILI